MAERSSSPHRRTCRPHHSSRECQLGMQSWPTLIPAPPWLHKHQYAHHHRWEEPRQQRRDATRPRDLLAPREELLAAGARHVRRYAGQSFSEKHAPQDGGLHGREPWRRAHALRRQLVEEEEDRDVAAGSSAVPTPRAVGSPRSSSSWVKRGEVEGKEENGAAKPQIHWRPTRMPASRTHAEWRWRWCRRRQTLTAPRGGGSGKGKAQGEERT